MDKLYRARYNQILGGVCGGLAKYFETDPLIIRLIFIFLIFAGMSGIVIYLILWLVLPLEPESMDHNEHTPHQHTTHDFAEEIHRKMARNHNHAHGALGFILIAVGVLFLLDNFYPGFGFFRRLWPVLLILIGLVFLVRDHDKHDHHDHLRQG